MLAVVLGRSLAGRVFAGTAAATLVFAVAFGLMSRTLVTWRLHQQLERHGRAIAASLRPGVIDAMALDDVVALDNQLRGAAAANPHVRYIVVLNRQCGVVAHTLGRLPGRAFVRALCEPRSAAPLALRSELGTIHDVAAPAGNWLDLHIGIGASWVDESLDVLTLLFASSGAAGLTAGLGVAWWLSRRIAGPLRTMAAQADRVACAAQAGATVPPPESPPPVGLAEVDALGQAVTTMAASLLAANQRVAVAQASLVRAERMAALGTFVAGTAHAVNNPLGGVRACLEMMVCAGGDAGRMRRYHAVAEEALGRIEGLVRRLVHFARDGGGERIMVDVRHVVRDSLVTQDVVGRKGYAATICLDLCEAPCHVVADPDELEQALTALVVNALQASPAGGEVLVQVTPAQPAGCWLRVDDSGPGVPSELRQRVFEPFFTTKPEGEGTGLGLWVVWGIVDRLGGRVTVGEAPQGGARLEVWLPPAPMEVARA